MTKEEMILELNIIRTVLIDTINSIDKIRSNLIYNESEREKEDV